MMKFTPEKEQEYQNLKDQVEELNNKKTELVLKQWNLEKEIMAIEHKIDKVQMRLQSEEFWDGTRESWVAMFQHKIVSRAIPPHLERD